MEDKNSLLDLGFELSAIYQTCKSESELLQKELASITDPSERIKLVDKISQIDLVGAYILDLIGKNKYFVDRLIHSKYKAKDQSEFLRDEFTISDIMLEIAVKEDLFRACVSKIFYMRLESSQEIVVRVLVALNEELEQLHKILKEKKNDTGYN